MSDSDILKELERNETDKQLIKSELKAAQKRWAEYVLKNEDMIRANLHPVKVRKKRMVRMREFLNKISNILGFTARKEEKDAIETYLQYRDDPE